MPHVSIELYPGRTMEQKVRLAKAITDQFERELGSKPEDVTIIFKELPAANWFVGGISLDASQDAATKA